MEITRFAENVAVRESPQGQTVEQRTQRMDRIYINRRPVIGLGMRKAKALPVCWSKIKFVVAIRDEN